MGNNRAYAAAKLAALEGPELIMPLTFTDHFNLSLLYNVQWENGSKNLKENR